MPEGRPEEVAEGMPEEMPEGRYRRFRALRLSMSSLTATASHR